MNKPGDRGGVNYRVKNDPRPKLELPDGALIAVTVSTAFEAFVGTGNYGLEKGKPTSATQSFEDYIHKVGVWRLLETYNRHGIHASFSVSGLAAQEHPECVRAMIENGHEVYAHGWAQGIELGDGDLEAERKSVKDTIGAIEKAGAVRPVGWSGPGSRGTANTLKIIAGEGLIWHGDDASADMPFVRNVGGNSVAILPRSNFPNNDLSVIHRPQNPVHVYFDNFKETFDLLYEEGRHGYPGWIDLMVHCDIGGRPPLSGPFQRALRYIKGFDRVWQARKRDLAAWALKTQSPVST